MQRNKDYFIVGVEAEPQHFAWMQRHLEENSIDPRKARLIPAAANSYTGECAFMVGDPTGNYGQSIVSEAQLRSEAFMAMLEHNGLEAVRVPCVDLLEVTRGIERVDYMHMDIQGSEAEFLLAHPDRLDECVALVNIGTHSELIERQLRRHFISRGWLCRYDIPMNGRILARYEGQEAVEHVFGDGVQVWENPRLTGRETAPSFLARSIVRG
jgi:FkbM family methyltransferase